jgi:hypothetical protein
MGRSREATQAVTEVPARRLKTSAASRLRVRYVVAFAVVAWGAGLCFAAFGPANRAAAVGSALVALASAAAALTALYISGEGLLRTDEQLTNAHRALVLSRYPILVPMHQSVGYAENSGLLAHHPPSADRFRLTGTSVATYAFIQDTNDRYLLPVENSGEGPALEVSGALWASDGRRAELRGASMIGRGRTIILSGTLAATAAPAPERLAECQAGPGTAPGFLIELTYVDVFGNLFTASAVFDPGGVGAWRKLRISGSAGLRDIPGAER